MRAEPSRATRFGRALVAGLIGVFLLVSVLGLAPVASRLGKDLTAAVSPAVLQWFVNKERKQASLEELAPNPVLTEAAQRKAEHMAAHGYFAHTSPTGETPWHWLVSSGYEYSYAGENLALNFVDSGAVTKAWMESTTHRANLLRREYTEIGTGVATGTFAGFTVEYVAQFYGRPR